MGLAAIPYGAVPTGMVLVTVLVAASVAVVLFVGHQEFVFQPFLGRIARNRRAGYEREVAST